MNRTDGGWISVKIFILSGPAKLVEPLNGPCQIFRIHHFPVFRMLSNGFGKALQGVCLEHPAFLDGVQVVLGPGRKPETDRSDPKWRYGHILPERFIENEPARNPRVDQFHDIEAEGLLIKKIAARVCRDTGLGAAPVPKVVYDQRVGACDGVRHQTHFQAMISDRRCGNNSGGRTPDLG